VVELLADRWETSISHYARQRQAHYFSAEFLEGRSLVNNLVNLGLYETVREAVTSLGFDLTTLEEQENDAALGNGGLADWLPAFWTPVPPRICPSPVMAFYTVTACSAIDREWLPEGVSGCLDGTWISICCPPG
jgi:hypothetical protein